MAPLPGEGVDELAEAEVGVESLAVVCLGEGRGRQPHLLPLQIQQGAIKEAAFAAGVVDDGADGDAIEATGVGAVDRLVAGFVRRNADEAGGGQRDAVSGVQPEAVTIELQEGVGRWVEEELQVEGGGAEGKMPAQIRQKRLQIPRQPLAPHRLRQRIMHRHQRLRRLCPRPVRSPLRWNEQPPLVPLPVIHCLSQLHRLRHAIRRLRDERACVRHGGLPQIGRQGDLRLR